MVLLVQFIYKAFLTVSRAPKGPDKAIIELQKKSSEKNNIFIPKAQGALRNAQ